MSADSLIVLVVDDDRGWRELYAAWLAEHDMQTLTDGNEAKPSPSGVEVAERLRQRRQEV